MKTYLLFVFLLLAQAGALLAQSATVRGAISDSTQTPISGASVRIEGINKGTTSDAGGGFVLEVPAGRELTLIFSHVSYLEKRIIVRLKPGEVQTLIITLKSASNVLQTVEIVRKEDVREQVSITTIDPKKVRDIPTPFFDFNQKLPSLALGLTSNNELSSSYSVRGGSFDENLVYVNNIEIYRPFLVRAGQQEGLSFVNPDLVKNIQFSSGGWQPKYGDKLASVLNIEYKTPTQLAGSASVGLLGGNGHLEGVTRNKRISFLVGVRHKSARYLLNTLPVKGQYLPRFTDVQTFVTFDLTGKKNPQNESQPRTTLALLVSYARNRYQITPQSRQSDFGTFQQTVRLFVAFDGQEALSYDTWQSGLKLTHHVSKKFTTHLIASGLQTQEREYNNVEGGYSLCEVNTSNTAAPDFNKCIATIGVGTLFTYSRNALDANIFALESRNEYRANNNNLTEFGVRYSSESISDKLNEYAFSDSSDFVTITDRLKTTHTLNSQRTNFYAQHSHFIGERQTLTYGFRLNHWNVNKQLLFSPRIQYSFKPQWKRDIVFNAALGMYKQPPFYREMRDFNGNLNLNLKAQSSIHAIAGMNMDFRQWDRPFKFITELYYKYLTNVIPYDMDNVRLRYYAKNNAVAYVAGADFRLSGEFVKGTDSWFGLSIMSAKEDVQDDNRGFIRRPVDQRVTLTMNFEDYIPNNPTIRVNMRLLYGTGLPFGPPNSNYRAVLNGAAYRRMDIGFSKVVTRGNRSLWFGLDILNLFGANNVISYLWISDFANQQYAVPNGLSQRFFNLRVVARFNE